MSPPIPRKRKHAYLQSPSTDQRYKAQNTGVSSSAARRNRLRNKTNLRPIARLSYPNLLAELLDGTGRKKRKIQRRVSQKTGAGEGVLLRAGGWSNKEASQQLGVACARPRAPVRESHAGKSTHCPEYRITVRSQEAESPIVGTCYTVSKSWPRQASDALTARRRGRPSVPSRRRASEWQVCKHKTVHAVQLYTWLRFATPEMTSRYLPTLQLYGMSRNITLSR